MPKKTRRRRLKEDVRRELLPAEHLLSPSPTGSCYPYPAGIPVLVDRTLRVLLGSSRVHGSLQTLPVLVFHPGTSEATHLRALDAHPSPPPSVRARAAASLQSLGVPLRLTQQILGCTDLGTASRWTRLTTLPWLVLHAMDRQQLSFGHARHLLGLKAEHVVALVSRSRQNRWTVSQLKTAISGVDEGTAAPTMDQSVFANALSEALGAPVDIHWPEDEQKRFISIGWYDVETLKGVLTQLSNGPSPEDANALSHRRELVIQVRNVDELEALTGHLSQ